MSQNDPCLCWWRKIPEHFQGLGPQPLGERGSQVPKPVPCWEVVAVGLAMVYQVSAPRRTLHARGRAVCKKLEFWSSRGSGFENPLDPPFAFRRGFGSSKFPPVFEIPMILQRVKTAHLLWWNAQKDCQTFCGVVGQMSSLLCFFLIRRFPTEK